MRLLLYISAIIILLKSCGNKPTNNGKQIFRLQLTHDECTGCLDATIINDKFGYPTEIKKNIDDTANRDIILEGKNPFKYKQGIFDKGYKREYFEVIGYFIRVDSSNPVGRVAVFYIEKSEKTRK